MDYNHISKLLERYFEGETTLAEERTLRQYFSDGPVAPDHLPYRDLFRFFAAGREESYDGKLVPDHPAGVTEKTGARRIRLRPVFWRTAAAVAIAAGAWLFYPNVEPPPKAIDWSKYEPATVEEAFQLTSKALKTASDKLNYGAKQAAQEVSKVKKVF